MSLFDLAVFFLRHPQCILLSPEQSTAGSQGSGIKERMTAKLVLVCTNISHSFDLQSQELDLIPEIAIKFYLDIKLKPHFYHKNQQIEAGRE